jgi:hypothetical protein
MNYKVQELHFDEEITLDCNNMPWDDTEGAELRDIMLSDMLHEDEFYNLESELDSAVDLSSNLVHQTI